MVVTSPDLNLLNATFVGRTEELKVLQTAFNSVIEEKESRVVSIAGISGTGKSRLVEHFISLNNVREKSMFCTAKCDKSRSNEPFSVLKDVLHDIAEILLADGQIGDDVKRSSLMEDIRRAVGTEGGTLASLVPALAEVLGQSTSAGEVSSPSSSSSSSSIDMMDVTAAKESLYYIFKSFFRAISSHVPLLLFCDDLQWVDVASMEVLSLLATDSRMKSFMLLFIHRFDEVASNPSTTAQLDELKEKKLNDMARIELRDMSRAEVNELLSVLLKRGKEDTLDLAEAVHEKTGGNTFFVLEYLQVLQTRNLLFFSPSDIYWKWVEVTQLRQDTTIADNVADLIVNKLELLSFGIRNCLRVASCLSSTVDAAVLRRVISKLHRKLESTVEAQLDEACEYGLLIKEGQHGQTTYAFVHNRIKHAAYSLVRDGAERENLHYSIGLQLLDMRNEVTEPKLSQWISFIVTEQLHQGQSCIDTEEGFTRLAELNLDAGKKAMEVAAFVAASQYFRRGLSVLQNVDNAWERHYELHLSLHQLLSDIGWCIGLPAESEGLAKETILHAKESLEKARGRLTLARALGSQDNHKEAITVLTDELIRFKVFPRSFRTIKSIAWMIKIKNRLKTMTTDTILKLPDCTDAKISIAHEFLRQLALQAVYAGEDIVQLLCGCLMTKLILKHGVDKKAVSCFAQIGIFVGMIFGDIKEGLRLGQVFRGLMSRCNTKDTMGLMIYWGYLHPWVNPLSESMDGLLSNYNTGMQQGHVEMAFVSFIMYSMQAMRSGLSLTTLIQDMESLLVTVREYAFESVIIPLQIGIQAMKNLVGSCEDPCVLTGEAMDEKEFLSMDHSNITLFSFHCHRMHTVYQYGYVEVADKAYWKAIEYGKTVVSFTEVVMKMYYGALIPLNLATKTGESKYKRKARTAINALRKAVTKEKKGLNISHLLQLVDAGFLALCQHESKIPLVQQAFDKAIKMSTKAGFRQDAAVANILAGQYFHRMSDDTSARHHFSRGIQLYEDWGAMGAARHLANEYDNVLGGSTLEKLHSTNLRGRQRHSQTRYSLHEQCIPNFLTSDVEDSSPFQLSPTKRTISMDFDDSEERTLSRKM